MPEAQPLSELLEVSDDLVAAVVFGRDGDVEASTLDDDAAREVSAVAGAMLAYADALRADPSVERVEAVTRGGGVFVVRDGDRAIAGITGPDPLPAIVRHDLREFLRKSAVTPREQARARA